MTILGTAMRRTLGRVKPGIVIDSTWPDASLIAGILSWIRCLVRGVAVLASAPGPRLRLCEPGITVYGKRWCDFGRWLFLEHGVLIRARGGEGLSIGDFVVIGSYTVLEVCSGLSRNEGFIRIGSRSSMGDHCYVGGAGGVRIGEGVLIGQYVSLHSQNHRFDDLHRPIREQGVTSIGIEIENDCWIGAGAKILDGVRIGAGSVIAAGAVVTSSVPPCAVVAGVPGRVIRRRGPEMAPQ